MIQETIAHQDGTTNNIQSSQPSQEKNIFRNILKIKINNIRKKNDKPKYQLEECNNKCPNFSLYSDTSNLEEDQNPQLKISVKTLTTSVSSSSETPLPIIIEPQSIASTSVTSFSDKSSIKPESTTDSWSKSSLFSYFSRNNSSTLKHKSSTTSDASTTTNSSVSNSKVLTPSIGQKNLVGSTKKKKKLFNFSKRSVKKWSNNYSNSTINSSIEISNSERNDSAYETEIDLEKKVEKKEKKKEKVKKIRKTKLKTLSPEDEDYIKVRNFFQVGLPNKKILGIMHLQMPTKLVEAHEQFKKTVAQSNNLSESQICHRMFHGTKTAFICKPQNFINKKYAIFCKFGCGVCGIAQEGNRTKYSRYTQRMWFANNSATSLSYCSSNNVKAMFVVDVVSTSPNSILIIEKEEATIPKYLIVFE